MSISLLSASVPASKNWILSALLAVRMRFGPPGRLLGSPLMPRPSCRALEPLQRLGDLGLAGDGLLALFFFLVDDVFRRALHELRIVQLRVAARDVGVGLLPFLGEAGVRAGH